jgi:hypothetical protein
VHDGYQIMMSNQANLVITGTQVIPPDTPITLDQGWNLAAFLNDSPKPTADSVTTIIDNLVLTKNSQGQVYWPFYSIDQIEMMQPGTGYQFYLSDPDTLIYPAN